MYIYQQKVQDGGIGEEGSKDEEHAGNHPCGYGSHALYIWRDIGDSVENIDEHEEERDKECHSAGHNLWRDQKAHPGDHHEQSTGEVVNVQISENIRIQIGNGHLYSYISSNEYIYINATRERIGGKS